MLANRCADPKYSEREVQVDVHWDGNRCEWTISDHGHGFDVDEVLKKLDTDEVSELASGRGILLMRAFMDEVQWRAGGREIRMSMKRGEAADIGEAQRTRVRHAVKAMGYKTDEAVDAVATAISPNGMELVARGVTTASRLMIEIEVEGKKVLVPAEVRHVTPMSADWVQFDCRFATEENAANKRQRPNNSTPPSIAFCREPARPRMMDTNAAPPNATSTPKWSAWNARTARSSTGWHARSLARRHGIHRQL